MHTSLGLILLELVLSRAPVTLSLEVNPREEALTPAAALQEFLARIRDLRERDGGNQQ